MTMLSSSGSSDSSIPRECSSIILHSAYAPLAG
jgi:hypothetical protein